MNAQQKKDLLAFVHDEGKGLIVGHATGVAFTDWPEFGEMVGGYMDSEFNANAHDHRRGSRVSRRQRVRRQHFHVQRPASGVQGAVLARQGARDHAAGSRVARRGESRAPAGWRFRGGLGEAVRQGTRVQRGMGTSRTRPGTTRSSRTMMLEGIKWAMGVTKADVTPRPFPASRRLLLRRSRATSPKGRARRRFSRCAGSCHEIDQAVSMRATEKDWKDVVALMVDRGATGSDEDLRNICRLSLEEFRAEVVAPMAAASPLAARCDVKLLGTAPLVAAASRPGDCRSPDARGQSADSAWYHVICNGPASKKPSTWPRKPAARRSPGRSGPVRTSSPET